MIAPFKDGHREEWTHATRRATSWPRITRPPSPHPSFPGPPSRACPDNTSCAVPAPRTPAASFNPFHTLAFHSCARLPCTRCSVPNPCGTAASRPHPVMSRARILPGICRTRPACCGSTWGQQAACGEAWRSGTSQLRNIARAHRSMPILMAARGPLQVAPCKTRPDFPAPLSPCT